VYFDNLQVSHNRGRIIEEDHYYAFGLKIAGISSTKLGDANEGLLKNNYLYNDKELWDEGDLNWYDYGFRNYDPQIGRFPQLDPLTNDYPHYTPFQYAGDEPIGNIDLDGLEPWNILQPVVVTGHATKAVAAVSNFTQQALKLTGSFVLGVANAWASNQVLGAGRTDAVRNGLTDRNGVSFQVGQKVGDALSYVTGNLEVGAAAGGEFASLGGATAVAVPVAIHGLSSMSLGLYNLINGKIVYSTSNEPGNAGGKLNESAGSSNSNGNTANSKDLKLTHSKEAITKSSDYEKIKKLTDKELIESVVRPKKYDPVTINTKTGKVIDGNTRIYEIQRRGLKVDVPIRRYTPDDSAFPDLP
jgi:RHS repeat-associated protein